MVTLKHYVISMKNKVYGDLVIKKMECLNHVAKRLETGLRKLIKVCSKSEDRIGGRAPGHLTEPVIKKLTRYYHNEILKNLEINEM